MSSIPCPNGRRQAAALTSMNMRAVIGPTYVTYLALPRQKPATVKTTVPPRFRPRDAFGQFASYADLDDAILVEYTMTHYEYNEPEWPPPAWVTW